MCLSQLQLQDRNFAGVGEEEICVPDMCGDVT